MSTVRERAKARHGLRRHRERELIDVMKAVQAAADAKDDGEKIAALRHTLELALDLFGLRMPSGQS